MLRKRMNHVASCRSLFTAMFAGVFVLLMLGVGKAQYTIAQATQGERQNAAAVGKTASARFDALELRLAQMEQMLKAQRTLTAHRQMNEATQLRERLQTLEDQLAKLATTSVPDTSSPPVANAGTARSQFNDIHESLRVTRGQTDALVLQLNTLTGNVERAAQDNEFRFQQIETGLRRATTGLSSTSAKPEILGRVKRQVPVVLDGGSAVDGFSITDKLVGEGDMDTAAVPLRAPIKDPEALYNRALNDLRQGNYATAESDFVQLVKLFADHALAGNAQYWLGETHFVRQQYKRAADAFLTGYTKYAKNVKAPDSLLKLGITLHAMGQAKTGCDAFAELADKFPDASQTIVKRAKLETQRAGCNS